MPAPIQETYEFLNALFERINAACFDDAMPAVVMTLKGKSNVFGYYKHKSYASSAGEIVDEIAVNPSFFATHGFKELMQSFAHEMCHQWQFHFGNPSRRAYHNKEFSEKMKSIGLLHDGPLPYLFTQLSDECVYIPWYARIALDHKPGTSIPAALAEESSQDALDTESATTASGTTRARYSHQC